MRTGKMQTRREDANTKPVGTKGSGRKRTGSKHALVTSVSLVTFVCCMMVGLTGIERLQACGGFFCQLVPIDQAGEQIIFRKDGNTITAIVQIQYAGNASDFSWVVPVPGVPQLSTGSDLIFAPLELVTRPQFILERTGAPCPDLLNVFSLGGNAPPTATGDSTDVNDGVEILQELSVGPFDIQIVSSNDAEALAIWLTDNNYDLSDRGRELITPYVDEGMNFVALRLQQDKGVGDLQPLIMRYTANQPMIPIRLTAVAAQADMGVIVWFLGSSRAVPLNYLHVTPNYTRLNWYAGTRSAYASYQGLITAAMNEAGGQGFATDYAGRSIDLLAQLPAVSTFTNELNRLATITSDAEMIASVAGGFVFQSDKVFEILRRELPLPVGEGEFIYLQSALLMDVFTADELAAGRTAIVTALNDTVIDPLTETLTVFDGDPYMTRLYTTLSPEEMTLDPIFSFNPDMDDQPIDRNATMNMSCSVLGSQWSLTLGLGTGRDQERVIDGIGSPPGFTPPIINQDAVWRTETIEAVGPATLLTQKSFTVAQVTSDDAGVLLRVCGNSVVEGGAGTAGILMIIMFKRRSRRKRRKS